MITTIQLKHKVKQDLDKLKQSKETYEDVIIRLITLVQNQKMMGKELLIEGCIEMTEESLRISKEWENVDKEVDWEW